MLTVYRLVWCAEPVYCGAFYSNLDESELRSCFWISFWWGIDWTCRCPQLETLSLKRTGTASAMLHCRRLINLDVSACIKLSDAGVRAAATACPLLASLDMSNCAYVSDETLREISLVCTHLRTLDASFCPNISLEVTCSALLCVTSFSSETSNTAVHIFG
jgi:hypothetical protein